MHRQLLNRFRSQQHDGRNRVKKEQQKKTKALSSDQPDWGQIFAAIPDAVIVLDSKGVVSTANKIAFTLLIIIL